MRHRLTVTGRDRLEFIHGSHIPGEDLLGKERDVKGDAVRTPVIFVERSLRRERAGQQPVRQRAVGHQPDPMLCNCREDLPLQAPIKHVISVLGDIHATRRHAGLDLVRRKVGDAHETRLAGLHDLLQRAHRLLQRRLSVRPVDQIDIHIVGPESLQTAIDRRQRRLATAVALPLSFRPVDAELGDDDRLLAPRAQRLAQKPLGLPISITFRRVEEIYPQVERALHRGHDLVFIKMTVSAANLPAAIADRRYVQSGTSKCAIFHLLSSVHLLVVSASLLRCRKCTTRQLSGQWERNDRPHRTGLSLCRSPGAAPRSHPS